ncbi:hypothetical protein HZS_6679 [Henneguya salminicola]|nr:hypothetical protein HZS_6679 [Henneguya salminicola]
MQKNSRIRLLSCSYISSIPITLSRIEFLLKYAKTLFIKNLLGGKLDIIRTYVMNDFEVTVRTSNALERYTRRLN